MWIKGDLHVHSHCCGDGTMSVMDIVEHSREFSDFIAISGHCRTPEFWRTENQYAEVVAVGPGGVVDGKEIVMEVKVGDKVLLSKYAGTEVKLDGNEYTIVRQSDVLAIVD